MLSFDPLKYGDFLGYPDTVKTKMSTFSSLRTRSLLMSCWEPCSPASTVMEMVQSPLAVIISFIVGLVESSVNSAHWIMLVTTVKQQDKTFLT